MYLEELDLAEAMREAEAMLETGAIDLNVDGIDWLKENDRYYGEYDKDRDGRITSGFHVVDMKSENQPSVDESLAHVLESFASEKII